MLKQHGLLQDQFIRIGTVEISRSHSEELFRAYVETANDMVYTVDLEGVLTYINSYGRKILGCQEDEILGRSCLDFVAPAYRQRTAQAFSNLIETGELRDFDFVLQPRTGGEVHLEVNGKLLYRKGELFGGMGIGRDISERKRIEKQLQMFSRAVESAYDATVITDLSGEVLYVNPAAGRIFSWRSGALLGKSTEIFYPERRQTQALIQAAIAGGWSGEVICSRRNGERFPALVSVGPIYDEKNNPMAVSFITRDITQQKQIEAELASKNIELERANRLKSEFLANMSHELRTPLTAILGFSSILKQQIFGTLNSKQQIYTHQIHQSGQHLLGLINDVLDLSKVEAGQMRLEIEPIAVHELCEDALALVREQAEVRKIKIHHTLPPHLPCLMADELRVRQMLLNLLSNAIKFSEEEGEIGLDVEVQAGEVYMTVWDKGIGVPEDKQHLLFKPFEQIDGSFARRREGTGLGLALTRRLAELHSGTVEVKSCEGQGSRFIIRLPLNASLASGADEQDAPGSIAPQIK